MACDDVVVQGITRSDRELLDAQALVGELVPAGSVFAFLAEHRHELFPDSFIADLFCSSTGRPSLPADLVGSVLVLKELFDLSDPQTADALRFDIRWKVACGRSLTQTSFDPSTLVYWRKRIAASDRPHWVFDAVARVIAETGIDPARPSQAVRGFDGVRRRGRHQGHGNRAGGIIAVRSPQYSSGGSASGAGTPPVGSGNNISGWRQVIKSTPQRLVGRLHGRR